MKLLGEGEINFLFDLSEDKQAHDIFDIGFGFD